MRFKEIVEAVKAERRRQDGKWGTRFAGRADCFWLTILAEEFGEVANAILDGPEDNISTELIQVAAVCFSWLEHRTLLAEQRAMPSGPAGHASWCAQPPPVVRVLAPYGQQSNLRCPSCGASWWSDKIPALAAARTSSTSARPDSKPSAQEQASAESRYVARADGILRAREAVAAASAARMKL